MNQKALLSAREAASALGVSYKVLLNMARKTGFPVLRVGEKKLKVPADQLAEWVRLKASQPLD